MSDEATESDERSVERHEASTLPDRPSRRRRGRRGRRPLDLPLLIASLVIAVGIILIIWGVSVSVTSSDEELPDAILAVSPSDGSSQVPALANIRVELEQGYEGRLFIDDTEIPVMNANDVRSDTDVAPGQEIAMPPVAIYEPGSATISFTPSDEAPIEEFSHGIHRARVIFWETTEGEETARSYSWDFDAL